MNIEDFRRLYDYNSWANHRTLEACAPLTGEQFTRDLHSSFRSVRDTLVHILLVEWLWRERWLGRSPDKYPPATDFPTLEALRQRWAEVEKNLLGYISSLKPEDLDRVIEHKTTAGVPQAAALSQMLQHLVNHGTYHRGQIATMLRQLDARPISTDLIFFYRERAAQAKA
ncbi:MAG: DinB family protein [Candidatus Acidiferrales bacterium]